MRRRRRGNLGSLAALVRLGVLGIEAVRVTSAEDGMETERPASLCSSEALSGASDECVCVCGGGGGCTHTR